MGYGGGVSLVLMKGIRVGWVDKGKGRGVQK